jgi:ABC-type transport system involved in multi-copper enzyme maturation permease subunit
MTPKTIRIFKEARSLFWPWLAVMTAAALPLLERSWSVGSGAAPLWGIHQVIEPASFLGFFIGLPLLATLSLGNEFQCRTISLLLSQPVGRTEIWSEKIIVALAAVLSAASLFCITGWNVLQQDPAIGFISAALMILMVA